MSSFQEQENNNDSELWNSMTNRFQDTKSALKNKIWKNKMSKYNDWNYHFNRDMDISFLQGSFEDLKNDIEIKKFRQDKYTQINPVYSAFDSIFLKPFETNGLKRGKIQIFKDFGLLRKQHKNKLGLCGYAAGSNVMDSMDMLKINAWTGINDSVNNEMNLKINYYSPNLPPEDNVNNFQFKGRLQQISNEQKEYLYQVKYQTIEQEEGSIYSFQSKMYVNEQRGIDRPNILFLINRKSMPYKKSTPNSSITRVSKQIFCFDYTRKSFFLKTLFYCNQQRTFSFDFSGNLLHLNLINNYQKGSIINIRPMINNEKLQVNYQPGYINNEFNEENSNLLHNMQNTTKLQIFKLIPYLDPFIQSHASVQLKNLRFGQYLSFKSFMQDNCKLVLSTGATVDLGFVKLDLYYNILDLIPHFFNSPQKPQFQKIQLYFGQ